MKARGILSLAALFAAGAIHAAEGVPGDADPARPGMVYVSIIGPGGRLTDPVLAPRVVRTDAQWKKILTPEQFRITRGKGTERAFCGGLLKNKGEGVYVCVGCSLPLFSSDAKFESGTGWPSFYQPISWTNMKEEADLSLGMVRTEILCPRCDAHMGHIFEDGPRPTGLRYCLNSESLRFIPAAELAAAAEPLPETKVAQTVLSGGLSFGLEAVFEAVPGVLEAACGEATAASAEGADPLEPADAVLVIYDPSKVQLSRLLKIHRAALDLIPPVKNSGSPKFRPAVFWTDDEQKQTAEAAAKSGGEGPVPAVEKLADFKQLPIQRQNMAKRRPDDPYFTEHVEPAIGKLGNLLRGGA